MTVVPGLSDFMKTFCPSHTTKILSKVINDLNAKKWAAFPDGVPPNLGAIWHSPSPSPEAVTSLAISKLLALPHWPPWGLLSTLLLKTSLSHCPCPSSVMAQTDCNVYEVLYWVSYMTSTLIIHISTFELFGAIIITILIFQMRKHRLSHQTKLYVAGKHESRGGVLLFFFTQYSSFIIL